MTFDNSDKSNSDKERLSLKKGWRAYLGDDDKPEQNAKIEVTKKINIDKGNINEERITEEQKTIQEHYDIRTNELEAKAIKLQAIEKELDEKKRQIDTDQQKLNKKNAELNELTLKLSQREESLNDRIEEQQNREKKLIDKEHEITAKEQELSLIKKDISKTRNDFQIKEEEIKNKDNTLKSKEEILGNKEKEINLLSEKLDDNQIKLNEKEESLKAFEKQLTKKELLLNKRLSNLKEVKKTDTTDDVYKKKIINNTNKNSFHKFMLNLYNLIIYKLLLKEGRLKLGAVFTVFLILIALSIFGFFSVNMVMSIVTGTGNEVLVPNLFDLHYDVARKKSMEMDLFVQQVELRHHDEIAQNRIISQSPEADKITKRNRTIEVVVSLGPELVRVPYLDNITEREARIRLENAGLRIGQKVHRYSDDVVKDRIIYSQPLADDFVPRGSEINIFISLGALPDMSDRHQRYRGVLDNLN